MELTEIQTIWIKVSICYLAAIVFGVATAISMNLDTHNAFMLLGKTVMSIGAAGGGLFSIWTGTDELP